MREKEEDEVGAIVAVSVCLPSKALSRSGLSWWAEMEDDFEKEVEGVGGWD